jgi:hypothetical protein
MAQIVEFPRRKQQQISRPAQSAEVIAFPGQPAPQQAEPIDSRTWALLTRRAAELIEARCHGGGLRLVLTAIHGVDPEWLDNCIGDMFDTISTRSAASGERAAAWQGADCWLRGVEPPAPFRFSWRS